MSDVTRILDAIEAGDPHAAEQLLPLVYAELRRLAAAQMARENPGQTLDATALVHEAYLRLIGTRNANKCEEEPPVGSSQFDNRGHFFAAAAEAMRRILIDNARRKGRVRHGGERRRVDLDELQLVSDLTNDDLLDLDDALTRLADLDSVRAELVKLRFFAGLNMAQAAATLGISVATAERYWSFTRAWLYAELTKDEES